MKRKVYSIVFLLVLVLFLVTGIQGYGPDFVVFNNEEVPLADGGEDTIDEYLEEADGQEESSEFSEKESEFLYENVDAMIHDTSLTPAMEVQTKGYYVEGIGSGIYFITDESKTADGGMVIALDNGLFACLKTDEQTVDVTQYGAYADGVHNDSVAIENALNSGMPQVTFMEGEYKCCNYIKMKQSDVSVVGNNSILFTDNDYQIEYYEWFFNIVASDITIDGLKFEARETITPKRKSQMGIMYASNIKITNCEFNIPNTVLSEAPDKNVEYTNLDIYTSWQNVTIDNCIFYDMADCLAGGCLEIRDIKGYDCSGCTFTNNICYANNHDEIIGVFCLSDYNRISNVTIKGNSFYQENTSMYGRAVGLSLGYSDTYGSGANNVVFEDNYFEAYSHFELIKFGKSEDVVIKNNTLISNLDGLEKIDLCLFRCQDAKNVKFESNDILINDNGEKSISGIVRGSVVFSNNTITCNSKASNVLFSGIAEFSNNELILNRVFSKHIISTSYDGVIINGNQIEANNWGNSLLYFVKLSNIDATKDIKVNDNEISLHNKSKFTTLLSFSELDMNNFVLYCNNNTVLDDEEGTATSAYLCNGTLINEESIKVNLSNNDTGALDKIVFSSK